MPLSDQEVRRREEREELMNLGINPYPAEPFEVNVSIKNILQHYEQRKTDYKNVSLAGRLMSRRVMGSASFAEIQDSTGRMQIYVRRDDICEGEDKTLYNTVFKKLLDIGDIVGVKGYVFTTQAGEITLHVTDFKILTKSLRPLPIVKEVKGEEGSKTYDAFTDPEQRYRQRYVDLIVNPEVKEVFRKRSMLVNSMRSFWATEAIWKWRHQFFNHCTVVLRHVPLKHTTTPWIPLFTYELLMSFISKG